jgi:uncharacterized membrane protein YdjX (TVP38/TMEM64 family)
MTEDSMCEPGKDLNKGSMSTSSVKGRLSASRLAPLAVLLIGGVSLWFGLDVGHYLDFETLQENREWLLQETEQSGLRAIGLFILAYALSTAFSLPIGWPMTVLAGFLFGTWAGTCYVVLGATIGATAVFLAARTALADYLYARAGKSLAKMEEGFRENAMSYLLFLRLVPVFPFFVVNLVPGLLGVSLKVFVLATFVGIIPGTFVYASVGNGLGALFDAGETPDPSIIFKPEILIPLIGLAVLSLAPIVYKKWKARPADK